MGKHEGPYKEERRHTEFSKVIVILAILMWLTVNIFGMVMIAITGNMSPMVYVIGSVDAVMAVICATYSYKAKAENIIKLKKLYNIDTSDIARESYYTPHRPEYLTHMGYSDYYDDGNYYDDTPDYEDASIV